MHAYDRVGQTCGSCRKASLADMVMRYHADRNNASVGMVLLSRHIALTAACAFVGAKGGSTSQGLRRRYGIE
jgi:hypothetical protein